MITTRGNKGSKLTHSEMDNNFTFLDKTFEYANSKPTTIPLGKIIEYKGELYKPAGSHVAALTNCSPELAVRIAAAAYVPGYTGYSSDSFLNYNHEFAFRNFVHPDHISVIDFSLDFTSHYYTRLNFSNEGLLPYIPNITEITQIINANLLINLRDTGTNPAVKFSSGMQQRGRSISKNAFIQFFTDLPVTNVTARIQIGASIVSGGTLSAGDIAIATAKGYTINVI